MSDPAAVQKAREAREAREAYAQRKALGLCVHTGSCRESPVPGRARCQAHSAARTLAERARARAAR